MAKVDEKMVLDALRVVQDPDLHRNIVELNFVKNIKIEGGKVSFDVELTTPACPVKDQLKAQAEAVVQNLEGVKDVLVNMTAQVRGGATGGPLIPGVKNTLAIASGKGGVGKSTVSTNVALALSQTGAKVGLFDADIYGPNIPQMLGIQKPPRQEGEKLFPAESLNIVFMSMGFMLQTQSQAVIWRGPMLHGAIRQFLSQVEWGELDYLVIDMPPGTGDIQLSLCQLIPLTGAVMVTTPQEVSLSDARKGAAMFQQLKVPILGVIENMSTFQCPHCEKETRLFPGHGGEDLAKEFHVPFLGRLPFDPEVGIGGDESRPIVTAAPERPVSKSFKEITGKLAQEVAKVTYLKSQEGNQLGQIRL